MLNESLKKETERNKETKNKKQKTKKKERKKKERRKKEMTIKTGEGHANRHTIKRIRNKFVKTLHDLYTTSCRCGGFTLVYLRL